MWWYIMIFSFPNSLLLYEEEDFFSFQDDSNSKIWESTAKTYSQKMVRLQIFITVSTFANKIFKVALKDSKRFGRVIYFMK